MFQSKTASTQTRESYKLQSLDGASIVLADDEYINRHMISSFLKAVGAKVTICENGVELLNIRKKSHPDIILTDIRMPVMNGLRATRKIREFENHHRRVRVPIIAITAHATQGYETICYLAGIDQCLTKPLDFGRLTAVVLNLCKKTEFFLRVK